MPSNSVKHRAAVSAFMRGMYDPQKSFRLGEIGGAFLTCQWLEGEARDRNFCGAVVKSGSSYCPDHHARCYKAPAAGAEASQALTSSRGEP